MLEPTSPRDDAAPDEWLGGVKKLEGAGREIFADVDTDEYVRQLREGWD